MADPLVENDSEAAAFTEEVRQRGPFASAGDADEVIRATLTGLSEAVSGGQLSSLLDVVPQQLHPAQSLEAGQAKTVDAATFLDRIGGYSSSVEPATVERQVRAVLSTVADWQPSGKTTQDTLAQLPRDLADLFELTASG